MAYTSLITFTVKPGRAGDFERAFARTGMLTRPRQVPGYLGAQLHRSIDDSDRYVVIGQWETEAAYRAWQRQAGDPVDGIDDLVSTLREGRPGELFDAVDLGTLG